MTVTEIINALAEHWFFVLMFTMLVMWGLTEMVKLVAKNVRRTAESKHRASVLENEAKLKALMVQRGMPPAEIERVLAAGSGPVEANVETRLEELMIENGMEASDIQRVLRARSGSSAGNLEADIVESLVEADYEASDVADILNAARVNSDIDDDAVRLIQVMAENEMESEDMQRVLRARRTGKVVTIDVAAQLKSGARKVEDILRAAGNKSDDQDGPTAPTRSA